MKKFLLMLAIFFVNFNFCEAKIQTIEVENSTPQMQIFEDVIFAEYHTWPERILKMNIFIPSDEKRPAVIFIPGGAWIDAPKNAGYQTCYELAKKNFVTASIEYRVIGAASYQEIIGDAKAAVRYLRANAEKFHIDKNKIAVIGASSGGHLATMLGVTGEVKNFDFGENLDQSSEVQAVVDFFGLTDLSKTADDLSAEQKKLYNSPSSFLSLFVNGVAGYKDKKGGNLSDNPEALAEVNPLNYIDKKTPPFLIFHGDKDTTVSFSQSKMLHDALEKNGTEVDFFVIKDGEHRSFYYVQEKLLKIIEDFLNKHFK